MNLLHVDIHVPSEAAEVCCRAIEMETKSKALHRSKISLNHTRNLLSLRIRYTKTNSGQSKPVSGTPESATSDSFTKTTIDLAIY
ncbi:MAG: hypothetical protein B6U86_04030 [Candidatus Altiarchaeales archaeon ex4484_43]|nr:MAG: hypothetical protein B6U86_04030 [Candidatus Altiarchaeales archaeon ex4484_43]